MATLKIPKEHQDIIELYANLPEDIKNTLVFEIKNAQIGMSPNVLADYLSTKVSLSKESIIGILSVLFNLLNAQKKLELSTIEFISVLQTTFEAIEIKSVSLDKIVSSLSLLIETAGGNSALTVDILNIMNNNAKLFIDAQFNNDIRPIFLGESNSLKGVVSIHNLKITYSENTETKEMYFSLDTNDLKKLKKQIELAEQQLEVLKSLNLNFIDIK
jgi:hypothetical protein